MTDIAIVGAGPYGLSVAAHLKRKGISFRIFGHPMDSWLRHMPKGMMLKSDGFASTVSDPEESYTLKHFCAERGIEYADLGTPVRLDTFSAFGLAFKDRFLPELEDKLVTGLASSPHGFQLQLEDGEVVSAGRVVLAVGITHFAFTPPDLAKLPAEFASHSFAHHDLEPFRGRSVVVLGGGSSAIDMAALLAENGANVQLVARAPKLKFHERQSQDKPRSLWEKIRHPQSGLGPGLKSRFCSNWPLVVHYLPENTRVNLVKKHLGPAGGWFAKAKIDGHVPLVLGYSVRGAEVKDGKVRLTLRKDDGSTRDITADHVIAATGYRVDLERLKFLSGEIRSRIKTVDNSPALSSSFESSVPGLYFVGVSAANSFGPLMRFAYGATFAAQRVSQHVAKAVAHDPARVPATPVPAVAKYSKAGADSPR
ncbi:MAG: NAD(P)-binding domain-containing protein [Candidatus Acidiferrales bacterium]|jgi:thioredoxin reductase